MLPTNRFFPDVFTGLAQSTVTSNVFHVSDAHQISWSLVSSSATASRWTIQGSLADGLQTAIDASTWVDAQGVTGPGLYALSLASRPRWVRWQRTPSNSSSTIALSYTLGA